jgi:hypothetical protein
MKRIKFTVELSEAEFKGIKKYLKEVGDIAKPTKKDVAQELNGMVNGYLQAPHCAVADYVREAEAQMAS